jgi:hypothetical protein
MGLNFDFLNESNDSKSVSVKDMDIPPGKAVKTYPVFDLESAKAGFKKYEDELQKMALEAEALAIVDDNSAVRATEMIAQVKRLYSDLDDQRKQVIKDPDQFVRKFNAFVKVFKDKLSEIERLIKDGLGEFTYRRELKRREEERKAQEELQRKQAELDKAAKKAKVDPVTLPPQNVPRKQGPIRSSSGTASTVMVPYWEIAEIGKVPRQYLMINKSAVDQAMKSGIRNIPGIEFKEKAEVRVRKV